MRRVNEDRLYAVDPRSDFAPNFRAWVIKHEVLGFDYSMTVLGHYIRTDPCSKGHLDYDGLLGHVRTHELWEPFSSDLETALARAKSRWDTAGGRWPHP
jgi:hypothetical protein